MSAHLLFAISLAISNSASSPSPAPIKVIEHVHSSLLCGTLDNNVAGAVKGLRINDDLVNQGRLLLTKMAHEAVTRSGAALQLDQARVRELVGLIVKNLDQVDDLLDDPLRFLNNPARPDQQQLALAKAQLATVEKEQRVATNVLSGTVETAAMQSLLAGGDGTKGALGKLSYGDPPEGNGPQTAGADAPHVAGDLFSENAYGRYAVTTLFAQRAIGRAEHALTPTVVTMVGECRSSSH